MVCEGGSSGDFGVLFGYLWDVKIGWRCHGRMTGLGTLGNGHDGH